MLIRTLKKTGTMIFRTIITQLKKNPGVRPLFVYICLGMGGAALYLIRLARGPHVIWNRTTNPEPWNKLDPTYQYKFGAVNMDYKKLKKEGPDF